MKINRELIELVGYILTSHAIISAKYIPDDLLDDWKSDITSFTESQLGALNYTLKIAEESYEDIV